jgi:hypothetical protein
MATQTRTAQVIDALIAGVRALPGHRAPDGTVSGADLVTVYDGPEIRSTDDAIDESWVVIGWSGSGPDDLNPAAQVNLSRGPIAATNRPRNEVVTISCLASARRGESTKAARDLVTAELDAVAGLLRSDPSLGINTAGTIGGVRTIAYVTAGTLSQYLLDGYVAEWEFTVTYESRV